MDTQRHAAMHASIQQAACSSCHLREICLPVGLTQHEMEAVDRRLVTTRRRLARGSTLFQAGDRFDALYAVWTGFFKTSVSARDGRDQVTGFQMGGELLGLEGIASRRHEVDAVALEDAQVCVLPYDALDQLAKEIDPLRLQLQRIMSSELVRGHNQMLLLGSMHAEERLAAFLVDLTQRLQSRGFSATALVLRMTRDEIGSYLGLTLETVSRTFSKFQAEGLLFVRARQVRITDPVGLQALAHGMAH